LIGYEDRVEPSVNVGVKPRCPHYGDWLAPTAAKFCCAGGAPIGPESQPPLALSLELAFRSGIHLIALSSAGVICLLRTAAFIYIIDIIQ
jgi:hypothetical protein